MRADALDEAVRADRAGGLATLRSRCDDGIHGHDGHRSAGGDRESRAGARALDARGCGDGRLGDDPAGVPCAVERDRGAPIRSSSIRTSGSAPRSICSTYFVRDPQHLVRVMSTNPSYLRTAADSQVKNFRDWGIPLGRRFRALKLWFLIREQGVERSAAATAPRSAVRAVVRGPR